MPISESSTIISNSSPLIHLSKIQRLDILETLFGTILIPKAVYEEVVRDARGRSGGTMIQSLCDQGKIVVKEVRNHHLTTALKKDLDHGESEVIALALETDHLLVLIDETEARRVARYYQLNVTGFIGLLLKAHKLGLVISFKCNSQNLI